MVGKITIIQLSIIISMVVTVLIIAMPFQILQIYAQQNNTDTISISESISETINSVALLIGVVAPLIVSGLAYVKANRKIQKLKKQ
jgi:hypothetical protein